MSSSTFTDELERSHHDDLHRLGLLHSAPLHNSPVSTDLSHLGGDPSTGIQLPGTFNLLEPHREIRTAADLDEVDIRKITFLLLNGLVGLPQPGDPIVTQRRLQFVSRFANVAVPIAVQRRGFWREFVMHCFPGVTRLPSDMHPRMFPEKSQQDQNDNYYWIHFFLRLADLPLTGKFSGLTGSAKFGQTNYRSNPKRYGFDESVNVNKIKALLKPTPSRVRIDVGWEVQQRLFKDRTSRPLTCSMVMRRNFTWFYVKTTTRRDRPTSTLRMEVEHTETLDLTRPAWTKLATKLRFTSRNTDSLTSSLLDVAILSEDEIAPYTSITVANAHGEAVIGTRVVTTEWHEVPSHRHPAVPNTIWKAWIAPFVDMRKLDDHAVSQIFRGQQRYNFRTHYELEDILAVPRDF